MALSDLEKIMYDPITLQEVVKTTPTCTTFFRDRVFTGRKYHDTEFFAIDFKKGGQRVAAFRHPEGEPDRVKNRGFETKYYTPPVVSEEKVTTASDILHRSPGENPINTGRTPQQRALEKLREDYKELDQMVSRREEVMCMQLLTTGKIDVYGKDVHEQIDFGFTNKTALAGTARWGQSGADILGNINTWCRTVQRTGFVKPGMMVVADGVADVLMADANIQKLLDIKDYDIARIAPKELPGNVAYIGTIQRWGLDIYSYNETYVDDWTTPGTDVTKEYMPAGGVLLLPERNPGMCIDYGRLVEADERNNRFITIDAARSFTSWMEKKPARRFVCVDSRPLPVPREINAWYFASVL